MITWTVSPDLDHTWSEGDRTWQITDDGDGGWIVRLDGERLRDFDTLDGAKSFVAEVAEIIE